MSKTCRNHFFFIKKRKYLFIKKLICRNELTGVQVKIGDVVCDIFLINSTHIQCTTGFSSVSFKALINIFIEGIGLALNV